MYIRSDSIPYVIKKKKNHLWNAFNSQTWYYKYLILVESETRF